MSTRAIPAAALSVALGSWRAERPIHRGLAERLRLLILDGRVPLGSRLPSERALADALGLSRTTVASAYDSLRESGHARSRQGSGTVADLPGPALEVPAAPEAAGLIDLTRAALPASALVPGAIRAAAEELPRFLDGTGYDLRGLPHLRRLIAAHYAARGLPTGPEQVLVTVGAQHAIHLLAATLVRRGDRALVESPTYPHSMHALRGVGARLVTTPVTSEGGWDPADLGRVLEAARSSLAYVMAECQNPTGATMSPQVRGALLRSAAASGTVVVADETTAGLNPSGVAHGEPLGARRGQAKVVHVGSLGKLFWGGLRVGWIRAERTLIERIVGTRPSHDLGTPVVEQLAAALLLPRMGEAVAERAAQLATASSQLTSLLARWLPEWRPPSTPAGFTAWTRLPQPASSSLAIVAREHGVLVPAGPWFGADGRTFEHFVRLPLTLPSADLERAVPALAEAWSTAAQGRRQNVSAIADLI